MSSGRKDYWYGMLPGKSILGAGQIAWYYATFNDVASGAETTIVTYTVPANYVLNVTGGIISSTMPGIQMVLLYVDSIQKWSLYFDQLLHLPFSEGSCIKLVAGSVITLKIYNLDSVECSFWGLLTGFLADV